MNTTAKQYAASHGISVAKARANLAKFPSRIEIEMMAEHSVNHRSCQGLRKRVKVYTLP